MRGLLGLVGVLGCVLLIACGDDDEPTPAVDSGVDSGPEQTDATVDSGTDARVDPETDAATDTDADTDTDAGLREDAATHECVVSVEVCDGMDNDCDTIIDEDVDASVGYRDLDGDGFGDATGNGVSSCQLLPGYSLVATDCDDNNSSVHPAAAESCDAIDNNCSGTIDEGLSCELALSALAVSTGSLSPALSADVTEYSLVVGLTVETIELTPTLPAPATITVAGDAVVSGQAWTSPTLNLGLNVIEIVVAQTGYPTRSYTISVTRGGTQQAYLKASNTDSDDHFGSSLAISGDTLVVAASYEASSATGVDADQDDNQAQYSGAVYVFVRDGESWVQQAYLKASNAEYGDLFGISVGLAGDLLVVGASREGSNATGIDGDQSNNSPGFTGAAYVFERDGSTWTQTAYLKTSNTGYQQEFGCSVAAFGDTVVVGARNEGGSGAAYVFVRSSQGVWSQQAYIKASNPGGGDQFGASLALSEDTLAVGAASEDSNATGVDGDQANNAGTNSGAVYVFTRNDVTWTQQAYLKASNTGASDAFGASVALSGDTLVVGAASEDSSATGIGGVQADETSLNSGAAYVFVRSLGAWSQQAYLKASNAEAGDLFGTSVAVAQNTLLIGAHYEDGYRGAAYVFMRSGSAWSQAAYLKAENADANDWFGQTVATTSDTFVVGAQLEDSNATGVNGNSGNNTQSSSGAVYVFQ